MAAERICIVSASCLSSGPRVEKEADALAKAGYDVHVIVSQSSAWMTEWDARIAASKRWTFEATAAGEGLTRNPLWLAGSTARRAARSLATRAGLLSILPEAALSDRSLALALRAMRIDADLYIAHNLGALAPAAWVAEQKHALLAFDSEDDHGGELTEDSPALDRGIVEALQSRYLPRCRHVTTPSQPIAELLASRYGIDQPTVVLNTFPWALRERSDGLRRERSASPRVSLYWYSQTVGLDRGLQDVLGAIGQLHGEIELHLRGHVTDAVRAELSALARDVGFERWLYFHPQVHPDELLSRSAEHDIGLALEQPISRNRLLTITNKLFFYLLAGLAVAATDTQGQRSAMRSLPDAGFMYAPSDRRALARGLQRWLDAPDALRAAKGAALDAARDHFSWERSQQALLTRVKADFASRAGS